jgi:hypothetical protein
VSESEYVVVVRGLSAGHFEYDHGLSAAVPEGLCVVTSEYVGGSSRWPLMLRAEIRGAAPDLEDAQQRLGARAGSPFPLVALAANAAHADPALVVAHGLSPNVDQPAEWIAYEWPPASEHVPPHSRMIDPNLVGALLERGDRFPSAGYHGRAVGLYREALKVETLDAGNRASRR